MLRISKLTDYATVILATLAHQPSQLQPAGRLAASTHISSPTVSNAILGKSTGFQAETTNLRESGLRLISLISHVIWSTVSSFAPSQLRHCLP